VIVLYQSSKTQIIKNKGKMEDLDGAIQVSRQAVAVAPTDKPELAVLLNNLLEQMGEIKDLGKAIQVLRRAVDIAANDHPDLTEPLNSLLNQLETQ
jgi:hypothetical protein